MSQSFWFIEFKKVLPMVMEGKAQDEIKKYCIEQNIFGAVNANRSRRVTNYITNRAIALDETELKLFQDSDLSTQKIINLIAIMKTDRLLSEFVYEVYRTRKILGFSEITAADIKQFFRDKELQEPLIEGWIDSTKNRLSGCYFNFLTEAGLLTTDGKRHIITPPLLDISLERYLEVKGETAMIKALTGATEMAALDERLDKAEEMIAKPSFRENKGLGNEVGYYIFDYMPKDELIVRKRVEYIRQKHEDSPDGFKVVVFDLYDITIEILKEKGYLEKCFDLEKNKGLDRVIRAVGNTLRLTGDDNLIVKYIQERTPEKSVVFIIGIGKCYPLIRSHTVLNNLHQVLDNVPVVMFYPGKYDGQELVLFGEVKDDNYYRAFKLVE